jgi:hypothetical protein
MISSLITSKNKSPYVFILFFLNKNFNFRLITAWIVLTMKKVKRNFDYLRVLGNCKKKMLKAIITSSDKELISCICECILNCLNGNIKLKDKEIVGLRPFKRIFRELLIKKKPLKRKKKILIQHGSGFLPILIPAIIQALSSILY